MNERRTFFRHGVLILTVAFVLGLVAGALGGKNDPSARLWMGSHVTGIMAGLLVIAFGVLRPSLRLGRRTGGLFYWSTIWGNWMAVVLLGIFASAVGGTAPIVAPNLPPPAPWQGTIVVIGLIAATITTFASCGLALYGLRGREQTG